MGLKSKKVNYLKVKIMNSDISKLDLYSLQFYHAALISSPEITEECSDEEEFKKAFISGNKEKAKTYLNKIDVNYDEGYFLRRVAQEGDSDILIELLERGANVRLTDALKEAAHHGHIKCVEILIEHAEKHGNAKELVAPLEGTNALINHPAAEQFFLSHELTKGFFGTSKNLVGLRKGNISCRSLDQI
jgi:hypothetical protein